MLPLNISKLKTLETLKIRRKVPNWLLPHEDEIFRNLKLRSEIFIDFVF